MERIAIIGLGLIGGSIGLALKQAGLKDVSITGTSRTRETISKAKKLGAIDSDAHTPGRAVEGARMVIIAAPILTIPGILDEIAPVLAPGTIITDVASTKGDVMRWALEKLPDSVYFVGGHPMAGKESMGVDHADAELFKGKPWVITPSVNAPDAAIDTVVGLAQLTGARPLFMDAAEHDSYVAAVSHLPLALATALFTVAFHSNAWPEIARLASSGFRDTTRLASGSPEMAHDILMTNRDNVLHWIDRLQEELYRYRKLIESGDGKAIAEEFARAQIERDNFMINGPPRRIEESPEIPQVGIGDLLLGSRLAGLLRRQEDIIKASEERAKGKR